MIVTLDFETYYDKDYSLSKMTHEEYIRDPRFEAIGVSIKLGSKPAYWVNGPDVEEALRAIPWDKAYGLAHHAAFDFSILSWIYNLRPKFILDTLSMAKPKYGHTRVGVSLKKLAEALGLPPKGDYVHNAIGKRYKDFTPEELVQYSIYGNNDNELCYSIFQELYKDFPEEELRFIDLVIRLVTEPKLCIDSPLLAKYRKDLIEKREHMLSALTEEGGEDPLTLLRSNAKFAELLRKYNVEPPTKISPRTGKTTFAFAKTDEGLQELLGHEDFRVSFLAQCRLEAKSTLAETRAEALQNIGERGRLPVTLNYWGAHTGRLSGGGKINLQNLTRGSTLRDGIIAPAGYTIIASDLAQIEARLLATMAGQEDLIEAFAQKRDVYAEFATQVYNRLITKADVPERFVGKTSVLGLGYGMGYEKLMRTLVIGSGGVSVKMHPVEAANVVNLYRSVNNKIPKFWKKGDYILSMMADGHSGVVHNDSGLRIEGNKLILPNGSCLRFPDLRKDGGNYIFSSRKHDDAYLYGAKMCENIIQALAALIIREQMLAVAAIEDVYPVLQVHDEIVSITPNHNVDKAKAEINKIMSTPPLWLPRLPIACEVGAGKSYGQAK